MKVKTFILSLLLTMFCSTSFGQHWGEIPNDYDGSMTFVTQIFINGELQGNDIEIGAFCGNEFRGSARPITNQANLVYLLIGGDGDHNGDQISFRLARHDANGNSVELDNVIFNALTYVDDARIGGSPDELVNGLLPEKDRTEFNSVAKLNGKVYPSLANALAACTTGDNTIELLKDNAEDVTIKQVEGVNITIDGGDNTRFDYSGTITIHGNARYQGAETLTFTNIDFTTDKEGHYFIDSNSTGSVERYAHNVTVDDCNFTATGAGLNSAVAMRIRQGFDIAINGGTFNGLHSVLQAYGNAGINITGIESNCKNGISVGSSTNVVITGSDITATGNTGYGVRAGENVTGPITITGTEINAFIPVSVRKVTDDTNCEFTFTNNTMNASNTDGYWCVIGTSEYEANGSLPETAGKIIVNATEADLLGVYGYSRVEVTFADNTTKYFYMMEDAVPYNNADNYAGATIKLLSNCAGRGLRFWENDMTFDLNGKKYTINQAVGSSGTESQGFQIRPEVIGNVTIKNGTIDIKAGTNVKWMFNSYAADFVVEDVTIDGTNMVTNTSEDYLLVVQNAGDKATFDNVTIQNYDAKKVYLEGNTTFVAPQEFDNIEIPAGYVLVYENGAYIVKAGNVLNANTGAKYATLADAITAATAGDTLQLLQDITEDVTITKNITLDGAGKNYTGKITLNKVNFTAENVNFVKGNIYKNKKTGVGGTYTIKNCTFDGQSMNDYAVNLGGTSAIVIEGVTAKDYGYGFLQVPASNTSVSVKDVEISNVNYGLKIDYSGGVTLENVKADASVAGVLNSNFGEKTITIKNSELSILGTWKRNETTKTTYLFEGNNTIGEFVTEGALDIFKLTKEDATLTAPEGFNVESGVYNLEVIYKNGCYSLYGLSGSGAAEDPFLIYNLEDLKFFRDHVNAGKTRYNAENVYVALAANIDMASEDWSVNIGDDCIYTFDGIFDGQGHTLYNLNSTETAQKADVYVCTGLFGAIFGNAVVKNLTIENVNINTGEFTGNNVAAVVGFVYGFSGKTVTIDGVKVTGDINIDASGVYGVGAIVGYSYNQGTLNIKNCAVEANDESAITAVSGSGAIIGYCGGKATIEACSVQNIDITAKGLVGGIAGITENSVNKVLSGNTVKDVTLIATKAEWVNSTAIAVGTMDGNGLTVANTIFENVNASRMVGSVYAVQPTYVVPAVEARIENKYYGTFDAALAAAQEGNTITVLAPVVITEDMTYDLTGLSVVGENVYPIFRIQNGANVVVANGNISNDDYVFVLGASDGSSAGNLTIESGVYTGTTTVASVTKGLLTINGGEFKVNDSEYGATYMINCIDANYNDDSANVEIYGGKFYGFNPENNAAEGANTNFCAQGYAANEIEPGVYEVVAGMVLNQTKGLKYATLSAAIAAASAGDTLVLLQNITENVTVDKSVTIDGKAEGATANSKYTGKMTVNASLNINIRNIDFVKGYINELGGAHGYFTIVDCNFDGVDKSIGYAVTVRGGDKLTIENTTAKNYSTGMLYIPSAVANIAIKDVEVSNVAAAFNISYSGDGTFENVKVDNVTYGLHVQNYGSRTFTLKDCVMNNVDYPTYIQQRSTAKVTFEFNNVLGYKETINSGSNQAKYGKYVLTSTAAKLTNVADDFNVTVSEDLADNGYVVEYNVENGVGTYSVVAGNIALERNGEIVKKFATIQAAIDEAVDGDEVVVLKDITFKDEDIFTAENYKVLVYVGNGKNITLNLNEHEIDIDYNGTSYNDLLSVVLVSDGAGLTVEGNGKITFTENSRNCAYMFFKRGTTGYLTINNGTFRMTDPEDSMIYTNGNQIVTIKGGTFILDEVGTRSTGFPLIFNATGNDVRSIVVEGGTYNDDVNHQVWPSEVFIKKELALKYNDNNTWTVVDAVAYVTEDGRTKEREVGYATLADAVNPHDDLVDNLVTVLKAHETTVPAVVERDMTIDFASLEITGNVYPVVRIQNDANVTVKNGNITNNDYVFVLGASDGSSAGNLTIESGVYTGTTTVASVTKGLLKINGGEFKVNASEYGATYMINCIDANYIDDSANVEIYGGKFYGFNPENNAAEGANTNFCALGYGAVENPTDVWTVVPKQTAEVKDGWNWFSYYVEGNVLDQLQNSLGAAGVQIKSRTQFTQYSNGNWDGTLVSTTPAESYKINVNVDAVINVTGNIVDPSTCYIMLNNGGNNVGAWNWIGYPLAQETSVETAFAGVVDDGDEIKTRTGFAEYVNGQWWGNLMTLEPGVGYMYFRAGDNVTVSDFTYPTPSSKEAVQPNITADANLWVPNSTSYANNMTMVAVLNMNGEMMNDNYEVAAMVNGEVRGSARPIYVEPMDAYMLFLTIHGEGVEEVTFQCYDFNTDTEYVLNNTINYSDDARLGSVNEPYVLCYGTMGIGENAMNTINIYPNPTTTGREINLGATCDKVEVYNALGVKVAEYQDVDTLDAIETAGIYVIRVTNDGDVKHCRLVVK